jgi:hypothetical protein
MTQANKFMIKLVAVDYDDHVRALVCTACGEIIHRIPDEIGLDDLVSYGQGHWATKHTEQEPE